MNVFACIVVSANTGDAFSATGAARGARRDRKPRATQGRHDGRTGNRRVEWLGGLASIVFHIALALFVLWQQRTLTPLPPPQPTAEAVLVELSLIPEAPRTVQRDLPPGALKPDRIASARQATRATHEPPILPDLKPRDAGEKPAALPEPIERPHRPEQPPAADAAIASEASAPPQAAFTDAPRHAAPQDTAGSLPLAATAWQQLLLGHLQRYKRYPRQSRRLHQQGVAEVDLIVDRRGNVVECRLARSSGYSTLDEEALAVARRASPVPAPPQDLQDPVQVRVPIEFHIAER
ncbi:energy transducer TonB [Lysobacter sp. CA199]|uniref:energy transducer TonB n=1 Tax=Lysobacter sp. CA199 TaxID=3455608 RepID=UPI003F8D2C50